MSKNKMIRWLSIAFVFVVLFTAGCDADFSIPSITIPAVDTPTTPPSTTPSSTLSPTSPAATTTKPTPATPSYPATKVDIYSKSAPWEYQDPDDIVMSPNILGFAWNLDSDPKAIQWAHSHGAKFIAEVSLWDHDNWKTLDDLPDSLKTAYNTSFDGDPLYNFDLVYLNSNHPAYQQWLSDFILHQIDLGVDGFVFDESSGNTEAVKRGGALDSYSMDGFGEYLAAKYTAAELQAQGIRSTANFDYKQYLIDNGLTAAYQRGDIWNINFGPDYLAFQQRKTAGLIIKLAAEARSYAETKGKSILITANQDPMYPELSPGFNDILDYYTFEHVYLNDSWRNEPGYQDIEYGTPVTPKIKYAMSQSKRAVALMIIPDYGELSAMSKAAGAALLQHVFAEAYASLGFFCHFDLVVPFNGYQFVADHARLRPYYQFLRDHPEAFNGLSFSPETAVIVPPLVQGDLGPTDSTQGVAFVLSESNIPYDVIGIDHDLDYKVVIANGYAWSDAQLKKLLDYARAGGTVIAIDGRFGMYNENYEEVSRPELDALKADGIYTLGTGTFIFFSDYIGWKYWASMDRASFNLIKEAVAPYAEPNSAPAGVQLLPYTGSGKLVVHILNYNYANNEFPTQKSLLISVKIPDGITPEGKTLTLLSPDGNVNLSLNYTVDNGWLKFTVPELYIWSVAVLG